MRVCYILNNYFPNMASPYEYSRKIVNAGNEVDVYALRRLNEPLNQVIDGVRVHRIDLRSSGRFSPVQAGAFRREIFKAIKLKYYDLIHVYSFRGCSLLASAGRKAASRWLIDVRTGNVSSSLLKSKLANLITRFEARQFDAVAVIDQYVARRVFGSRNDYSIFPLGTDTKKFTPGENKILRSQLEWKDQALILVYAGSIERQRRLDVLVQAFAFAVRDHSFLRLLILGDGTYRQELIDRVQRLGMESLIKLPGYVPYDQIEKYIVAGDVGMGYVPIVPQYNEQPPLKTVEYLACGLPTIATATLGNQQYIHDGENGILVNDDPASIAEAMIRLADDDGLRGKIKSNARSSIIEYDWVNIVNKFVLPVYERLFVESHKSQFVGKG